MGKAIGRVARDADFLDGAVIPNDIPLVLLTIKSRDFLDEVVLHGEDLSTRIRHHIGEFLLDNVHSGNRSLEKSISQETIQPPFTRARIDSHQDSRVIEV